APAFDQFKHVAIRVEEEGDAHILKIARLAANLHPFLDQFGKGFVHAWHMQRDVVDAAGGVGVVCGVIAANQFDGGAADVDEDDLNIIPSLGHFEAKRLCIELFHGFKVGCTQANVVRAGKLHGVFPFSLSVCRSGTGGGKWVYTGTASSVRDTSRPASAERMMP